MTPHISDAVLHEFVQGTLNDAAAVEVALHLDDCPRCAARAASLEPLHRAFAMVPDVIPPAQLTQNILDELDDLDFQEEPRAIPVSNTPELLVGSALLTVAVGLVVVFGDPIPAGVELLVGVRAANTALINSVHALPSMMLTGPFVGLLGMTLVLGLMRWLQPDMNLMSRRLGW